MDEIRQSALTPQSARETHVSKICGYVVQQEKWDSNL